MDFKFLSDKEIQSKKRFMKMKISAGNKVGFFFVFLFCALPIALMAMQNDSKLNTFSAFGLFLIPISFFMMILVFSTVSEWEESMEKYEIVEDYSSITELADKMVAYPNLSAIFCKVFKVRGYLMKGEYKVFLNAIQDQEKAEKKMNDKLAVQKILHESCPKEVV